MKKCPYCAEEIQDEAIVCRFCNRTIDPSAPATVEDLAIQNKEKNAKTLAELSAVCGVIGLCFAALPMGLIALALGIPALMMGNKKGTVGVAIGVINIILGLYTILGVG